MPGSRRWNLVREGTAYGLVSLGASGPAATSDSCLHAHFSSIAGTDLSTGCHASSQHCDLCDAGAPAATNGGHANAHYSSAPGNSAGPTALQGSRRPAGADAIFEGLNVEIKEARTPLPASPCCSVHTSSMLLGVGVGFRRGGCCIAMQACAVPHESAFSTSLTRAGTLHHKLQRCHCAVKDPRVC